MFSGSDSEQAFASSAVTRPFLAQNRMVEEHGAIRDVADDSALAVRPHRTRADIQDYHGMDCQAS